MCGRGEGEEGGPFELKGKGEESMFTARTKQRDNQKEGVLLKTKGRQDYNFSKKMHQKYELKAITSANRINKGIPAEAAAATALESPGALHLALLLQASWVILAKALRA